MIKEGGLILKITLANVHIGQILTVWHSHGVEFTSQIRALLVFVIDVICLIRQWSRLPIKPLLKPYTITANYGGTDIRAIVNAHMRQTPECVQRDDLKYRQISQMHLTGLRNNDIWLFYFAVLKFRTCVRVSRYVCASPFQNIRYFSFQSALAKNPGTSGRLEISINV